MSRVNSRRVERAKDVGERLAAGLAEIEPLLLQSGFERRLADSGKGSGGHFATAEFTKDDRRLHLWLRYDSLSVHYAIGDNRLDHTAYMRELLGPGGANQFPSYSNDVSAAFRALNHDLEHFAADFLTGSGEEFLRCWAASSADEQRSGMQRLARIEGKLSQRHTP